MCAYGNWGAWVFRNGERIPEWEDNTPYHETELIAGYWQAFGRNETVSPHHAVLGQQRMRLCGYKHEPTLFLDGKEVDMKQYVKEGLWEHEEWEHNGTTHPAYWSLDGDEGFIDGDIEGYHFTARTFNGNMIDLRLVEPDGTAWTSRCGYGYGAGCMDDEDAKDEAKFFA